MSDPKGLCIVTLPGVADAGGHDGLAVGAVQPKAGDHGVLAVVDPVQVLLDRVHRQLSGIQMGASV